jgi:hypothetical protein
MSRVPIEEFQVLAVFGNSLQERDTGGVPRENGNVPQL